MNRLDKAKEILERHQLDSLIVDNPIDLFYLTGLELSLGRLVITKEGQFLFVDGRYYEKAKTLSSIEVKLTSGYGKDSAFEKEHFKLGKRIGFDSVFTTYQSFEELSQINGKFIPLKSPIKRLREIKEEIEIKSLKSAAELGSKGYDYSLNLIKEGITEAELAIELELFWRKSGGEKLAFTPHFAFGPNSAFPHHKPTHHKLAKGNTILIDIGVVKENYHSDMTRVVFYKAPYTELEKIYFIVKDAQAKALEKCKPGTLIKDVDAAARSWISQKGYGDYFSHSLGHGVGLEIHEFPLIRSKGEDAERPLQAGMVITIEPGIYLPGIGGVRLEDTIVITRDGFENLTQRPLSASLPIL